MRLHSEVAKYDKNAVAGFSPDTARNLAELAEKALETGGKVSFAAACAVALKRELDGKFPCPSTNEDKISMRLNDATNKLFQDVGRLVVKRGIQDSHKHCDLFD